MFTVRDSSGSDTITFTLTITAYISLNTVTVQFGTTSALSYPGFTAPTFTDWDYAVGHVGGLWHLEGLDVSVQGDGWVIANPNNDAYAVLTVSSGRVTLPEPTAVVHVGLPYVSDLVTCDMDDPNRTIMTKNKIINSVTCYVVDTREFWAGEELPDSDDSLDGLKVNRQHQTGENMNEPPALFSEPIPVNIKARWNIGGRCAIRNTDPLPCEIIAVNPDFKVGS
jgi:hypothetical protein